jgi:diguanylate cyclase (GGDEF)-like protein/PAS domain S-box-containing protein
MMLASAGLSVASALRVLVVEDNPDDVVLIREEFRTFVDTGTFDVSYVSTLGDALAIVNEERHQLSCVLLDLSLPDASRLEGLEALRTAEPTLPVIVLTGFDDESLALAALATGAQDYLGKTGLDGDRLRRSIRYAVERERADTAIAEADERFRHAFADAPVGMALIGINDDDAGVLLQANTALVRLIGLDDARASGDFLSRYAAPGFEREIGALVDRALAGEPRPAAEICLEGSDGSEIWCDASASVVRRASGTPRYAVVQLNDVTARRRAEERTRFAAHLLDRVDAAVVAMDRYGRITHWSDGAERLYGLTHEETLGAIGRDVFESVWPPGAFDRAWSDVVAQGSSWLRIVLHTKAGGEIPISCRLTLLPEDSDGGGFVSVAADITEQERQSERLERSAHRHATTARLAESALILTDTSELFEVAAKLVVETLACAGCAVIEQDATGAYHARASAGLVPARPRLLRRRPTRHADVEAASLSPVIVSAIGTGDSAFGVVEAYAHGNASFAESDLVFLHLVANVLEGAVRRESAEAAMRHSALHDSLTGLPNRTLLSDRLASALRRRRPKQSQVAVLFIELDHFHVINESLGHEAGDHVLVETSRRLRAALRQADTVARFGGDSFVVVCEGVRSETEAVAIAETIERAITQPLELDESHVVTASAGIVLSSGSADAADTLLRDADTAMQRAKALGGARYAIFDERMGKVAQRRVSLERALRLAVDRDELRLHYQPIVSLVTGEILGVEALVRWARDGERIIPPFEFIPIAEESSLILSIGEWVLHRGCTDLAELVAGPIPNVLMTINLAARQLADPGIGDIVAGAMRQHAIAPASLAFEITESATVVEADSSPLPGLGVLDDLGVRLIVDDFGTGFSALAYLEQLPITGVKIDRSFVSRLDGQPSPIVGAILGMSSALGLDVIAEGIERPEQAATLRDLGCVQGQGYVFARPMVFEKLLAVVRDDARFAPSRKALVEDALAARGRAAPRG